MSFVGSNYHAGDHRPNANWDECLSAANEAMFPIVEAYGGVVLDMTAEMNAVGFTDDAFIDQWHFSATIGLHLAKVLHQQVRLLLPTAPGADHISHSYMLGSPDNPKSRDVIPYEGEPAYTNWACSRASHRSISWFIEANWGKSTILGEMIARKH